MDEPAEPTSHETPPPRRTGRWSPVEALALAGVLALAVQSAWLGTRADATLLYAGNVVAHLVAGLFVAALLAGLCLRRFLNRRAPEARPGGALTAGLGAIGAGLLLLAAILAVVLAVLGNTRPREPLLFAHVAAAGLGAALLVVHAVARALRGTGRGRQAVLLSVAAAVVLATVAALTGATARQPDFRIRNPALPPATMADESMAGAKGPFFPSSIRTSTGGRIPSDFFLGSEGCGRSGCHPDIVGQWRSSMHHFASFNNQFYRKSIEYMQSVVGVQPSKWCAGCHDVALLLDGRFDRPIQESLGTPQAQAGLACTACHAVTHVGSTMGNGDYLIEYPPLHRLAASTEPLKQGLHDLVVRLDPAAHRKTFLKPFHLQQRAEFCSSCHKVHLDRPVNDYRWTRGFDDYDNWQASGVSGMGARSFYYPKSSSDCVDCHMPLVRSNDKGNRAGFVHEHRFTGANTAVPFVNGDQEQLERVEAFLKDKVTVDVFAVSRDPAGSMPVPTPAPARPRGGEPGIASTFPVGEEAEAAVGSAVATEAVREVVAPLDAGAALRRGESVRLDVVVRTRGVGHFFPGGTVDAFDVWVELRAADERGRIVFWSGRVDDDGKGPVEPGAHFYRSLLLDDHGNRIDKRNAWAARTVVYSRLVPPGAADVVHYRLQVPADCGDTLTVTASLRYRKFSHAYSHFAYSGAPVDGTGDVTSGHDDRTFTFSADTSGVSGKLKSQPDLPIVTVSSAQVVLPVLASGATLPALRAPADPVKPRWNDYGIGLLLQGDLRGALSAFERVTRLDPDEADGWVNVARVHLREGDVDAALLALDKALALQPQLARAHFFEGQALKEQGRLDEALVHFEEASRQYPRDRVVLDEIARVHFLQRDFAGAVAWGRKVLDVDPEDLRAHYTLMLASRGLGDEDAARAHQALYERFKADEPSQELTGDYRRAHPEDNNERQPIHEHASVQLVPASGASR